MKKLFCSLLCLVIIIIYNQVLAEEGDWRVMASGDDNVFVAAGNFTQAEAPPDIDGYSLPEIDRPDGIQQDEVYSIASEPIKAGVMKPRLPEKGQNQITEWTRDGWKHTYVEPEEGYEASMITYPLDDDRPWMWPRSTGCKIISHWIRNGVTIDMEHGSGNVIAERVVSTAAHVVWKDGLGHADIVYVIPAWAGDWNEDMHFPVAGQNYEINPWGWTESWSVVAYIEYRNDPGRYFDDLAIIRVENNLCPITGCMPLHSASATHDCDWVLDRTFSNGVSFPKDDTGSCYSFDGYSAEFMQWWPDGCEYDPSVPFGDGTISYYYNGGSCGTRCYPGQSGSGNYASDLEIDSIFVGRDNFRTPPECISAKPSYEAMSYFNSYINSWRTGYNVELRMVRPYGFLSLPSSEDPADHREMTIKRGHSFRFQHSISNCTTGTEGNKTWNTTIYLSSNNHLDGNDIVLAYGDFQGYMPEWGHIVTWYTGIMPRWVPLGTYYMGAELNEVDDYFPDNVSQRDDMMKVRIVEGSNAEFQSFQADVVETGVINPADIGLMIDYVMEMETPTNMENADNSTGMPGNGGCYNPDGELDIQDCINAVWREMGLSNCSDGE